ncbi:MAG: hypothetical protein WC551_01110 [Patescibacteria group bacterium]
MSKFDRTFYIHLSAMIACAIYVTCTAKTIFTTHSDLVPWLLLGDMVFAVYISTMAVDGIFKVRDLRRALAHQKDSNRELSAKLDEAREEAKAAREAKANAVTSVFVWVPQTEEKPNQKLMN